MSADRGLGALSARIWPGLALALGALAYWPLLASALQVPTAHQVESWLFRPSQLPPPVVLGIFGWLLWRRREPLRWQPDRRNLAATAALALAGTALFVWAILTRSTDVLLLSLAPFPLAFGSAAQGRSGARAAGLPAAVLVLGVGIPAPLRNEIVWYLQRATTTGSAWLLDAIGREFTREGVILRSAEHSFHVIDGCSGLQGIATLTLIAILVGELLLLPAQRRWLLIAIAPALGYALNAARIAYIAASPNPEALAGMQADHTPQGVALLAAGTAVLYGAGRTMVRRATPARGSPSGVLDTDRAPGQPWRAASIALAALAVLSFAVSPFAPRAGAFLPREVRFSADGGSVLRSTPLAPDPFFIGTLLPDQAVYRRYSHGASADLIDTIDLFIAFDGDGEGEIDASHLLSSKRLWPGPDWNLEQRRRARIWDLGQDGDLSVAARATGAERAVVYAWRLRDQGLWRECLRSLFALQASPFRRERKRAVIRLVAYSPSNETVELDRAKQRLDQFIAFFRADFEAL